MADVAGTRLQYGLDSVCTHMELIVSIRRSSLSSHFHHRLRTTLTEELQLHVRCTHGAVHYYVILHLSDCIILLICPCGSNGGHKHKHKKKTQEVYRFLTLGVNHPWLPKQHV